MLLHEEGVLYCIKL